MKKKMQISKSVLLFLKDLFNLEEDKAKEDQIAEAIQRGVIFKGINVWVLIFAIFIASVGLNMNSTAVIIGAMLISPLMGPIMGVGLGVATYNFPLIKQAAKNLSIMVGVSLLTSFLYFSFTPLSEAQSELLARTTPSIWDVLIAFFGGLAGIVAGTVKEKGNVVAGVAIATALMPPICTAGYGLAMGNLYYFLGAFYLFFINAVFICFSSFLFLRFLKFPKVSFVDKDREVKVKRWIYLIVVFTVLPSIYSAYRIVLKTIFEQRSNEFLRKEFVFDKTDIFNKKLIFSREEQKIEIYLVGEPLSDELVQILHRKMPSYGLENTALLIKQPGKTNPMDNLNFLKDLYAKNEKILLEKEERIKDLETRLQTYEQKSFSEKEVAEEIKAVFKWIQGFSIYRANWLTLKDSQESSSYFALLWVSGTISAVERGKMESWLKARLKTQELQVIFMKNAPLPAKSETP